MHCYLQSLRSEIEGVNKLLEQEKRNHGQSLTSLSELKDIAIQSVYCHVF